MSVSLDTVQHQTTLLRAMCIKIAEAEVARADLIPNGWNNNIRWHIGHLITTPRLLTFGLLKEDIGMPAEYRTWFAKGSSPRDWKGATIPPLDELIRRMQESTTATFKAMEGREDKRFPEPYKTSVGVVLSTPLEALTFSQAHDGIHLGMLLALKRSL